MAYIKIIDGQAVKYTLGQLRRDNPDVSFPSTPSDELLADYDIYPLVDGERPAATIVDIGPIELIDGSWTQTYTGREPEPWEKRAEMIVTARQARLALQANNLLDQVNATIATMEEPIKTVVSIEWEYATQIERTSDWVQVLGGALNLSDEALDALFEAAAGL